VRATFQEFERENTRASADITELFRGLTNRVSAVRDLYVSLKEVRPNVTEFSKSIEQLSELSQKNSLDLFTAHEEMSMRIQDERTLLVQQLESRMNALTSKLEALQAKSMNLMRQSQDLLADAETSQFEFRKAYTQTIAHIQTQFNGQLAAVKKRFTTLNDQRNAQILEIREQISHANDTLCQAQQSKIQDLMADRPAGARRSSTISDEIKALNQRCTEIEAMLETQQGKGSTKKKARHKGVRVFYNIQTDGTAKVIIVDEFGIVGP
jgi:hypothetical protein